MLVIYSSYFMTRKLSHDIRDRMKTGIVGTIPSTWFPSYWIPSKKDFLEMGFRRGIIGNLGYEYNEKIFATMIEKADVIYIQGGNTFELLAMMKIRDVLPALRYFVDRGGTLMGSSAGGIVMCPDISIAGFADQNYLNLKDLKALNLVNFYVKPHWDMWAPKGELFDKFANEKQAPVIGLREWQGIIVYENGKRKFLGKPKTYGAKWMGC